MNFVIPVFRKTRRHLFGAVAAVAFGLAIGPAAIAADDADQSHWVASWATSSAAYFVYASPVPQNQALGFSPTKSAVANIQPDLKFPFPDASSAGATANNQTFRSIVKPDLWDNRMRIRFSNVFGNQPVTFDATTVALQEYAANVVSGTVTQVTFGGAKSVTVPVGREVWSDMIKLGWVDDATLRCFKVGI